MAMLDMDSTVITVDYNPKWMVDPKAHRIESLVGYSTDPLIIQRVHETVATLVAQKPGHVLVVLDSDHSEANVFDELKAYASLVTLGSYVVVEDTNVNGHPSAIDHGPGPYEAAVHFLAENDSFVVDHDCQRFLLTFNPDGWLGRVS
jgi:cephalosporin hydroxylase